MVHDLYDQLTAGRDLSRAQAHALFLRVLAGEVPEPLLAGLLTALKIKGERAGEIAGAADALRERAVAFPSGQAARLIDTCGTGGDGAGSYNISTAVALVCAELGMSVVKHGNRSVSSRCGSADVLEQLGVALEAEPEQARRCLDEVGICFLYAPRYHAGVRHAMGVRRSLGRRTIFNLLGPLINPARPSFQLLGVYAPELCLPLAETLRALGLSSACVVHGSGLDEVAAHGPTQVARLIDGRIESFVLEVADFGLAPIALESLRGGDPRDNARWLRDTLAGRGAPEHAAAIAVNVALAQLVYGLDDDLARATERALACLASGRPAHRLNRFVETSHGPA